jgi:hypothetical protein
MDDSEKDIKKAQWVIDCYKCGTQNSFGLRYCVVCGEKFAYKCPQCGADIEPGFRACPYCTVPINWGPVSDEESPPGEIEEKKTEAPAPKEVVKENRTRSQPTRLHERKWFWLIAFIIVVICIAIIFAVDIFL